ncbi:hypothetical protein HT031_004332 [Scenedesmus sp. PABB004]|nr:hypothetical protein HT031_004332 [Scenedesmus sp. PABB004]
MALPDGGAAPQRDEGWSVAPHPRLVAAAPTRAQFDDPATSPVVVMRNPTAGEQTIAGSSALAEPVPINGVQPIPVETALFKGHMLLHIKGVPSTVPGVFEGKKRFLHFALQGRFKRPIKASDYWTGHEWFSVSDVMPTSFVNIGYTAAAKMFSSTTRVCASTAHGQVAGFLNPVMASCQLVNAARPGEEPPIWEATEDLRLLCPSLVDKHGNPMPAEKRRRWFDVPANAASVEMGPDLVFTWHAWQHWCCISSYRLELSRLLSFDLCMFSEGQPMQLMGKDTATGEYSINLLLWHKHLLFQDEHSHTLRERLSSLRSSWRGLLGGGGGK